MTSPSYEMSYAEVARLLEENEKRLHEIYRNARLPEKLRRNVRDLAAQTDLLKTKTNNYGMRCAGVVRAKN